MSASQGIQPTVADRWMRRGLITGAGIVFAFPYFELLNRLDVTGDEILEKLPRKNVVFLSNHQTYFADATAFYHVVYVRHRLPLEDPFLRFSAAEETMRKNPLTELMVKAGGVTFRRSFREGGVEVNRPVDLEGVSRVEEAIRDGWLLHFPAGTTQDDAPIRPGVAQLLHRTKAVAVPVRIDGFRRFLLYRQVPGRLFQRATLRIHPPLDTEAFYREPYAKDVGRRLVARLTDLLNSPVS